MSDWCDKHKPWTEDAWNNIITAEEAYKREMNEKRNKPVNKESIEDMINETGLGTVIPK